MTAHPKKKLISLPSDWDDNDEFGAESVADAITRVLGPEALEKVRAAVGGARVDFPAARWLKPDHWFALAVGYEEAKRFCDEVFTPDYGADHVYIPLGRLSAMEETRQRIRELLEDGLSANAIALTLKCHVRTVFRTKRKIKELASNRPRKASCIAERKSAGRRGEQARRIVRQLLCEGHSAADLRDILAVPGSVILSIKTELIREGKL